MIGQLLFWGRGLANGQLYSLTEKMAVWAEWTLVNNAAVMSLEVTDLVLLFLRGEL